MLVYYSFVLCPVTIQMKLQQSVLEVQLTPFNILLRAVLDQLQEKDQAKIFAQPVNVKEVWSPIYPELNVTFTNEKQMVPSQRLYIVLFSYLCTFHLASCFFIFSPSSGA